MIHVLYTNQTLLCISHAFAPPFPPAPPLKPPPLPRLDADVLLARLSAKGAALPPVLLERFGGARPLLQVRALRLPAAAVVSIDVPAVAACLPWPALAAKCPPPRCQQVVTHRLVWCWCCSFAFDPLALAGLPQFYQRFLASPNLVSFMHLRRLAANAWQAQEWEAAATAAAAPMQVGCGMGAGRGWGRVGHTGRTHVQQSPAVATLLQICCSARRLQRPPACGCPADPCRSASATRRSACLHCSTQELRDVESFFRLEQRLAAARQQQQLAAGGGDGRGAADADAAALAGELAAQLQLAFSELPEDLQAVIMQTPLHAALLQPAGGGEQG